jgi:hypothetical protein
VLVGLVSEGERQLITFLPEREGLTCLEFVRVFSLALKPDTSPEIARHLGDLIVARARTRDGRGGHGNQ